MIIILDWIFEGIVNWIASIVTAIMDAISGLFLNALGTNMVTMEEYFPFVTVAFQIMQYTAWCILFLITIWQLFKTFGGPITEAENPWHLLVRSALFAFLIGYARPIFTIALNIARAPYTALMDASIGIGDFTFAGVEQALINGLVTLAAIQSVVGLILLIILMICLGWNYFKTLLQVVERYIVVGVLCYTSPLAFSMGGSKATGKVFQSWCRMVGSQLLLLVMNVWFLRAFNSSVGQFTANGGALTSGQGNIFLWMFCALAFLKVAQKFDSILSSLGLNIAQTGGGMGLELMMASRVLSGFGRGGGMARTAGSIFGGAGAAAGASGAASAASMGANNTGAMAGFASKFKGNSYVRDAVVDGGSRMGAGGGIGLVGRTFGGMAAKTGATLTGDSISSVAARPPSVSGSIGGNIADRSLSNYMPHMAGKKLSDTQITGGQISTTAIGSNGKQASVQMYNAGLYDRPDSPHSVVKASDGSTWYQTASGAGMSDFYSPATSFTGDASEAAQVKSSFPEAADGTMLRTVDDGVIEATNPDGSNSMWYNSALYQEPDAPHDTITSSDGVGWYAMQPNAETPSFETGEVPSGVGSAADSSGGVRGVPFDGSAHEAADIKDSSTISDGIGSTGADSSGHAVISDGAGGVTISGDAADGSVISEGSALPGGTVHTADSSGGIPVSVDGGTPDGSAIRNDSALSGGAVHTADTLSGADGVIHTPVSGESPDGSAIRETSSLPGGTIHTADGVSSVSVDSSVPEGSAIRDTSTLASGTVHTADSGGIPVSVDGGSHDSSVIRETSALPGGTVHTADTVSGADGAVPGSGIINENAAQIVKTADAVSESGSARIDSEGIGAGSGGISTSGDRSGAAELHDTPSFTENNKGISHSESAQAGVSESSDGVGVMARNLSDYRDTSAADAGGSQSLSSIPDGSSPIIQTNAEPARFDAAAAAEYNQAQFRQFMPGYEQQVSSVNASRSDDGVLEVRHPDGTGTALYDKSMYKAPRGEHHTYEDSKGGKWYGVEGTPTVERRPVYENGKPVYNGEEIKTVNVEGMKYKTTPEKFSEPQKRDVNERKTPKKKQ